jgi:hypothetical protein
MKRGVVHLRRMWADDKALCGPIGAWSEAVLAPELVTCKRCLYLMDEPKRKDMA